MKNYVSRFIALTAVLFVLGVLMSFVSPGGFMWLYVCMVVAGGIGAIVGAMHDLGLHTDRLTWEPAKYIFNERVQQIAKANSDEDAKLATTLGALVLLVTNVVAVILTA